jgi:hypothetical protein
MRYSRGHPELEMDLVKMGPISQHSDYLTCKLETELGMPRSFAQERVTCLLQRDNAYVLCQQSL